MNPYTIEAEYESGYVHRETDEDRSPYVRDANIFSDIVNRRPDQVHGPLKRFTLFLPDGEKIDVDFSVLPDHAEPVRRKHMEADFYMADGVVMPHTVRTVGVDFGYEYKDGNGELCSEIEEIR